MSTALAPLDDLAARINAAHDAAAGAARTAIEHAIECGRLLIEAKAAVAHGKWLPWLEANVTVGPRQAQKYMRLAEHAATLPADGKCEPGSYLGINRALQLLAAPDDGEEPKADTAKPRVGYGPGPRHLQPEHREVPVNQILIGPRLRRRRQDLVDMLAEDMAIDGLMLQPLLIGRIAPDLYLVICGRHRLEAAIQLGWNTVPCTITRSTDRDEWLMAEIAENLHRAPLSPALRDLAELTRAELVEKLERRRARP